jgi:hypothetical protein
MEMSDAEYTKIRVDNLTEMMSGERFHSWAHTVILLLILWRVW